MYAEVAWVLVSSITHVQPQIILDPDYLPDYLSVSYGYDFIELQSQRARTTTQDFQVLLIISSYLHPEVFYKKGFLRSIGKCIGKHLLQSLLSNKVGGLQPATLLRKIPGKVFYCKFCKTFKNTIENCSHIYFLGSNI